MRKQNPIEVTELEMKAEAHNAKAALLLAGTSKLLSEMICGSTWGNQISIDAAIGALQEAKREMQRARLIHASIDFRAKPRRRR